MAKKKSTSEKSERAKKFRRFLVANYVLHQLQLLDPSDLEILNEVGQAYGIPDWRADAKAALIDFYQIQDDKRFWRRLYNACCDYMKSGFDGAAEDSF